MMSAMLVREGTRPGASTLATRSVSVTIPAIRQSLCGRSKHSISTEPTLRVRILVATVTTEVSCGTTSNWRCI